MVRPAQTFGSTRTAGFWLAAAIAALQGVTPLPAAFDPQGVARDLDLPTGRLGAIGWAQAAA